MKPNREFFSQDVLLDARLASRHRVRRAVLSVAAHVAVVGVLLALPKSSPVREAMDDAVRVVFFAPEPKAPSPVAVIPPRPAPRPKPVPKPEPVPRPVVPPPPRAPEPAPAPPPVEVARVTPPPPPPPPARKPVTGLFADAPASPAPTLARKAAVASAGFEVQPAVASVAPRAPRAVAPVGFADEAAPTAAPSRTVRPVASTGFESEASPTARVTVTRPTVQAAAFDAKADAPAPRARARRADAADTPVEIVSKPRPAYTEQARRLRVEGEVVLEVVFYADGRVAIVRVVEGLGHGLDEAAIEAAKKIEFQPARREGRPVDHEATLRIVFKLA
jgi:TonB family protein